jgi:hypothetical protein
MPSDDDDDDDEEEENEEDVLDKLPLLWLWFECESSVCKSAMDGVPVPSNRLPPDVPSSIEPPPPPPPMPPLPLLPTRFVFERNDLKAIFLFFYLLSWFFFFFEIRKQSSSFVVIRCQVGLLRDLKIQKMKPRWYASGMIAMY